MSDHGGHGSASDVAAGDKLIVIRAQGVGRAGTITEMTAGAGGVHSLLMDEPPARGGTNQGMLPLEAMLASYAGCSHVIMNIIGGELGVELSNVRLDARGHLDPRGWMGVERVLPPFKRIELKISCDVGGAAENLETLKEQLSWRCPVGATLRAAGVDVEETWDVPGTEHRQTSQSSGQSA